MKLPKENIGHYLKAINGIGIQSSDLFETPDLYEKKNLNLVITHIHVVAHWIEKTVENYYGPKIQDSSQVKTLWAKAMYNIEDLQAELKPESLTPDQLDILAWYFPLPLFPLSFLPLLSFLSPLPFSSFLLSSSFLIPIPTTLQPCSSSLSSFHEFFFPAAWGFHILLPSFLSLSFRYIIPRLQDSTISLALPASFLLPTDSRTLPASPLSFLLVPHA